MGRQTGIVVAIEVEGMKSGRYKRQARSNRQKCFFSDTRNAHAKGQCSAMQCSAVQSADHLWLE